MIFRPLASRWFLAFGSIALVLWALASFVEFTDSRDTGVVEDVLALRDRNDINVLFILIDTLRADRLGAYGYERDTSPTFDYLARTGVRFTRHLSQSSWTKCSMASLWTGLNPARTGVLRAAHAAPDEAIMPAEIFREAGFRTAGIWRNGWVAPNFGFAQGFEVYQRPAPRRPVVGVKSENPHITLEGTDNDVIDAAIEFLRVNRNDRWFLYVHLMDVHQYLYDEDTAFFGAQRTDIYDNSIRHTDDVVGRLIAHLADSGMLKRTLVVWTSDHGEAFSERGFEGHARTVYRETTEVPFLLAFPFVLEPGLAVESLTANVDVWPTVLDLLGLPALPNADGRSLVPEILTAAGAAPPRETPAVFAHIDQRWGQAKQDLALPMVSISENGFRFVHSQSPDGDFREELFDHARDSAELQNLLAEEPEVAERLRRMAAQYLDESETPWGVEPPQVELDEMELNQLRALGYALP